MISCHRQSQALHICLTFGHSFATVIARLGTSPVYLRQSFGINRMASVVLQPTLIKKAGIPSYMPQVSTQCPVPCDVSRAKVF